jgi:hypothetical protein
MRGKVTSQDIKTFGSLSYIILRVVHNQYREMLGWHLNMMEVQSVSMERS